MENGLNLTEVTDILSKEFGIKHRIIPASNDRIETTIITDNREMHLQEFWVKNKGKPEISDVIYNGIDNAKPAQNVIKSIEEADKIIISRLYGFTGVSVFSYDAHKNNLEWFQPVIEALGVTNYD